MRVERITEQFDFVMVAAQECLFFKVIDTRFSSC